MTGRYLDGKKPGRRLRCCPSFGQCNLPSKRGLFVAEAPLADQRTFPVRVNHMRLMMQSCCSTWLRRFRSERVHLQIDCRCDDFVEGPWLGQGSSPQGYRAARTRWPEVPGTHGFRSRGLRQLLRPTCRQTGKSGNEKCALTANLPPKKSSICDDAVRMYEGRPLAG